MDFDYAPNVCWSYRLETGTIKAYPVIKAQSACISSKFYEHFMSKFKLPVRTIKGHKPQHIICPLTITQHAF